MNRDVLEFVERSQGYKSLDALFADFARVISGWDFHSFIYTGLPSQKREVEKFIVRNNWKMEWTDHYRDQNYFVDDPVSLNSYTQSKPFFWQAARNKFRKTQRARQIEAEALEYGMRDGLVLPMYDTDSWQAVISLASRSTCKLSLGEVGQLYLLGLYCHSAAMQIRSDESPPQALLSPREREILQWIAVGKSNWDVSMIMGISEGTVQQHLHNVRRKMDAQNTTHAVTKAIKSRQILI